MDYEIVWNAYYAILSKYAATNGLDYHKYLDLKQMAIDKNWEAIYESYYEDEPVTGKWYLLISVDLLLIFSGTRVFIPNEEIDYKTFTNKTSYLNLTIDCRIVRLDDAKKMFVLSHKDCLSYNIPKFLEEATETIKSKVISLSSDEILFDLNQFDGYISLSENPDI